MQSDSLGKLLPQILFPYARHWAERSGMPLLSKLLMDEQLHQLVERYSDELLAHLSSGRGAEPAPSSRVNGKQHADDPLELQSRLNAIEAQHQLLLDLLETVRSRMRPLALALGCCPECLVGVAGCPKCLGESTVGHYEPDAARLEDQIVRPLAARGVPLTLNEAVPVRPQPSPQKPPARKRSRQWPTR